MNCPVLLLVSLSGCSTLPRLLSVVRIALQPSSNSFQQVSLPFPEMLAVLSAPVMVRNAGSAAAFARPRASTIGGNLMDRW